MAVWENQAAPGLASAPQAQLGHTSRTPQPGSTLLSGSYTPKPPTSRWWRALALQSDSSAHYCDPSWTGLHWTASGDRSRLPSPLLSMTGHEVQTA